MVAVFHQQWIGEVFHVDKKRKPGELEGEF